MLKIAEYDERYRPYDKSGNPLVRADWVKLPANPKSDGLQALLEYKRGLEYFGIWCLLLEKTTTEKEPINRGKLLNHRGLPADVGEIAKSISLSNKRGLVENAISALLEMGWLVCEGETEETSANFPPASPKSRVEKSRVEKSKYKDSVFLSDDEYKKLVETLGEKATREWIEELNIYLMKTGRKYKSHYFAILSWHRKDPKASEKTKKARCFMCEKPGLIPIQGGKYICTEHNGLMKRAPRPIIKSKPFDKRKLTLGKLEDLIQKQKAKEKLNAEN